ncbi:protein eva-1 B-like, partial [Clarias magur]
KGPDCSKTGKADPGRVKGQFKLNQPVYHEHTLRASVYGVKIQDKVRMDVKRKEMDLLSNSIAAYAHIK